MAAADDEDDGEKEDRHGMNLKIMSCKSQTQSNRQQQQNNKRANERQSVTSLIDCVAFQSAWRQTCVVYIQLVHPFRK
jgi:hypothetical protein